MTAQMCKNCGNYVSKAKEKQRGGVILWVFLVLIIQPLILLSVTYWFPATQKEFASFLGIPQFVFSNNNIVGIMSTVCLWAVFVIALHLLFSSRKCCPKCGSAELIGLNTVIGKEMFSKLKPEEMPGGKQCPKCGKVYDDSWGVCIHCNEKLVEDERIRQNKSDQKLEKENAGEDFYLKLEKLAKLKEKGIMTQGEYDDKKKILLDGI